MLALQPTAAYKYPFATLSPPRPEDRSIGVRRRILRVAGVHNYKRAVAAPTGSVRSGPLEVTV